MMQSCFPFDEVSYKVFEILLVFTRSRSISTIFKCLQMSSDDESSSIASDVSSAANYSSLDEDELEELFDNDGEDDDFTGFAFNLPENMSWQKQRFDVNNGTLHFDTWSNHRFT